METPPPGSPASPTTPLDTEDFAAWLRDARQALKSRQGMDVPCGECRGCCTSAYFIPIGPEETATLAAIPKPLLFKAPGAPKGHVLLGYGKHGHCPLFIANRCTIYENRPRTCRQYDCRVFPATGISPGEDKPLIAAQAGRWKFAYTASEDRERFAAVQAAASFLEQHGDCFPAGFVPGQPTQRAVMALKVYEVFLGAAGAEVEGGEDAGWIRAKADAAVAAYRKFETGASTRAGSLR